MITHFTKIPEPKKSVAYSCYWHFAAKRYDVFTKRLNNTHGPWTDEPAIRDNRFTNVFRASDRVSQFLINLQYGEDRIEQIFFKTILFKIFNKIETYQYLEKELGKISLSTFDLSKYNDLLTFRMASGKTIYSAAYIMPSAGRVFGYKFKHTNHLALIEKMIKDKVYDIISDARSLQKVYEILLSYPSLGSFLAFQYAIDLNYSTMTNFSEMDFVVAGPGAKSGIMKCFEHLGGYSYEDVIKLMADTQEEECIRLNIDLPNLWGRKLQLIDCQNLFCEVDKYLRITRPELNGPSGRTRIKQKYVLSRGSISLFFPPKWNINDKLKESWQAKVNVGMFS
ncbi:nucleotide kinase domain-containing protein [Spirosoma rhododendri]|uniref:5-hmdU DNA kinase helical domain-containing protein n=1 Tax=Spirosoma rhododendri TaxID=2728024 RepID=A0A7L5DRR3_9BACT|nr:nucleotide kinase domain-containing protein [Spirosoma rhododendri]QJD81149.1 hypothetical protein HH216_24025 [Spirosoma rhododendri]